MGPNLRRKILLLFPAAMLAYITLDSAPATGDDGIGGRCVCPLPQDVQPDVDTKIFASDGPFAVDFRLIDVSDDTLTSLLETARTDYNFIYFLDTASPGALHSLKVLQGLRDRGEGRIGLTVVFFDPVGADTLRQYLAEHCIFPDFALRDPHRSQVRCYGFDSPSVLHVVGPQGRIMLAASEKNPVDMAAFTADLGKLLASTCPYSSFAEARGIYDDAVVWLERQSTELALLYLERVLELQPQLYTVNRTLGDIYRDLKDKREAARHYGRYLAGGYAYDSFEIRRKLKDLSTP